MAQYLNSLKRTVPTSNDTGVLEFRRQGVDYVDLKDGGRVFLQRHFEFKFDQETGTLIHGGKTAKHSFKGEDGNEHKGIQDWQASDRADQVLWANVLSQTFKAGIWTEPHKETDQESGRNTGRVLAAFRKPHSSDNAIKYDGREWAPLLVVDTRHTLWYPSALPLNTDRSIDWESTAPIPEALHQWMSEGRYIPVSGKEGGELLEALFASLQRKVASGQNVASSSDSLGDAAEEDDTSRSATLPEVREFADMNTSFLISVISPPADETRQTACSATHFSRRDLLHKRAALVRPSWNLMESPSERFLSI
ncbi:uncharacterized protein MKK02DRAFT_31075 [Dioszegia hungarica]|uniref:Uncharacterized protein n=1 Tax=Dioszegia hungarica TaxID=4972 RepID=A0AA38HE09_9TREE|nr:uncharacterized protein MKK02DRAFT_31075 [Dioszegia hungarica]KAI9638751.1 hypothetical protein MKK02DRAFT_31075 [Dioszegia hungarica]